MARKQKILTIVVLMLSISIAFSMNSQNETGSDNSNQELASLSSKVTILQISLGAALVFGFSVAFLFVRVCTRVRKSRSLLNEKNFCMERQNTELIDALNSLKRTQAQLVQSEKMASLGMLTAGIAHEINNPINFISGGIQALERCITELKNRCTNDEESSRELFSDIEDLMNTIKNGVTRTTDIVMGLKSFAKPDDRVAKNVDIKESLDSTLTILNSKLKGRILVRKDYSPVNAIKCKPGQINQVLLNIIDNAIQALEERKNDGAIVLRTYQEGTYSVISIRDNGQGIPDTIRPKIFDPFFTTKEVGKGTGLGLSISYNIIKEHNGVLEFKTETGKGTEFIIKLPSR